MDDEDIVLEVAGEMLKSIGYDVEFAKDGAKVIDTYKKAKDSGEPFDIVIMDLTISARHYLMTAKRPDQL